MDQAMGITGFVHEGVHLEVLSHCVGQVLSRVAKVWFLAGEVSGYDARTSFLT